MSEQDEYIELRLNYPGHPYCALLGHWDERYGFERLFDPFYFRREFTPDGQQVQIHRLPLEDFTYEIEEVLDGKRCRRYVATREEDFKLYVITREDAEAVAEARITVAQLVARLSTDSADSDGARRDEPGMQAIPEQPVAEF